MSKVQCTVVFLVFLAKFGLIISHESENIAKKHAGFLLSVPRTLVSGKNESVCLSLHEAKVPAKTIIDLKWKEKHYSTVRTLEAEHSCFQLHIPRKDIKEPQYVSIRVQVQINGGILSAHNLDPILMYPYRVNKTFIQTDRGMYKPGDRVKFRVLTLDENFLPVTSTIPEIRIKNPQDVSVAVWENVHPDHGLVNMEHQMVTESMTGKWKIEVGSESKIFEVFKYVLPRFTIDLIHPKIIYYKTQKIEIDVCARYSYGMVVKGMAFVKVTDSHNNMVPISKILEMTDGCAKFVISDKELNLSRVKDKFPMYDPKMHIHITATVTEKGTSRMDITTGKSLVQLKAYSLKFQNEPTFQPGLPYLGKLKLSYINVDISGEVIEICYNVAIKKSWNYLNNEQCSNFYVGEDNNVEFAIPPMKSNVIHVHINARSLNHTSIGDSFLAVRLFSPSSSYLYLEQNRLRGSQCDTPQQFTVTFTTDKLYEGENVTFYYMIKTQSEIYKLRKINHHVRKTLSDFLMELPNIVGDKHKFLKTGTSTDRFVIKFKFDKKTVSKYNILVYYVTKNGEMVAATKSVVLEPCLFKVDAKWSKTQMIPGQTATLNIKTDTEALCSVTSVDKATTYLVENHETINLRQILKSLGEEREGAQSGRKSCMPPTKRNQGTRKNKTYKEQNKNTAHTHIQSLESTTKDYFDETVASLYYDDSGQNTLWDLRRRKRHVYSFSEDYDSYDIFNKFGTVTITNLKLVTKPCYNGPLLKDPNPVQFLTDQYENENEDKQVPIRSYFPETWLWELTPVQDIIQLKRDLPHSITSWKTNVLCVSKTEGIGFSNETEITSFQPFFIQVLTPYSVKRSESFYLSVQVSNYLGYNFPVKINLRLSSGLTLVHPHQNKLSASYCLLANGTVTHSFSVRGAEMGMANMTVLAETDSQYPSYCGPETVVSKRDVVFKTIKVEPEGYPMVVTKSALLCASDTNTGSNGTFHVSLPADIIDGTNYAHINFNGDLLGQTLENLEELVSIPTGCGEQIMASVAPNLYILRYLNVTGTLTNSLRQRIIRNLKIGYQRILNYAHKDGSFSAFGYHDPAGSMFLTAFVVRILQEAKQYIYVDQRVIEKAVTWIYDHQLENGCFNTMYHVFQDMGGTNTENSTAALTSYVILSLLEADIHISDSVQTNAKYCIRSQHNPDKYSLVLSCYALFKVHWISEGNRLLRRIMAVANKEQNMMWLSNRDSSESTASDIELTSYMLLSLLQQNTTENLANAHSVARWLTTKIGPMGGFKSTQDTVVALDALAKYAAFIRSRDLDLKIYVQANEKSSKISLKDEDRLKSKKIILENGNVYINVHVTGEGCALTQVVHSYYLKTAPKGDAFNLALDVSPVSNVDECSIKIVSPCIAYNGPEELSNMAVMEVALPSGYEADRASLYKLVELETSSKVKMFEELQNQVNLYFTKLDKQQICFSFNIRENSIISDRKENLIKLYDYYNPEYRISQFYVMNNTCGGNASQIPDVGKTKSAKYMIINDIIDDQNTTSVNLTPPVLKLHKNDIANDSVEVGNSSLPTMDVPSEIKLRKKRNVSRLRSRRNTQLESVNKDFVDLDVNMDSPNCTLVPYYVKAPSDRHKRNVTDDILATIDFIQHEKCGAPNNNQKFLEIIGFKEEAFKSKTRSRRGANSAAKENFDMVMPNGDEKVEMQQQGSLNPAFVNMNVEMQTPKGMEGMRPTYVKASPEMIKKYGS